MIRWEQHDLVVVSLATTLCLALFGCGSSGSPSAEPTEPIQTAANSLIPPPATMRCQNGPTRPITVSQLRDALKVKGFSVAANPYSDLCSAEAVEIELSNILFEGPSANIEEHSQISEEQGNLGCALRATPLYADRRVRVSRDGAMTWMFLENVECSLTPSETVGERQIARLRAALSSLEASP